MVFKKFGTLRRYFPSLLNIFKSFRLRSTEFLRENTLHGFPYFVDPRRPIWERIVWFICTAASIGAAIWIILTIMEKFKTDPTLTGLDTHTDELKLEFPSIILCKMQQEFKLGSEVDAEHLKNIYYWSWGQITDSASVIQGGENYASIFYRATPECGDLYENCTYGEISIPCDKLFRKVIITRGICCLVDATVITKESKPWELSFDTTAYPISVDILEKSGLPPRRRAPYAYVLTKSTTIQIRMEYTYSTEALAFLPLKQRKCLFPEEALSYNICFATCQKAKMLHACECLPWYYSSLGRRNECKKAGYNCLSGNATSLSDPDCNCYLPCNHVAYQYEKIEEGETNNVQIIMPSWPAVAYKREVRFGWLDLLVSFGGIAGLFVGYSLLTTVELGYYLSLRSYCGAVLAESDKTIKIKAPKRRIIKVIDLKKDYYDYVN